ncbi:ABC transporter ATP-binding protein [Thermoflavimicrobium dichotomicum]|uniref:ABC-2 type transport system ATP-binding protein n=1 Tax=Thermoflavimicrobium dichotomicum TaxID=46223 RepID=A0A1I3TSV0_9BACL|nr:ABC transporter ATP-binding protein [Thermoflavimicrobium dichotomicum]SFJ73692.1 ABC-2 type transport system ATP-binding protein [Thermoflavimicrobium dichotomicum]
MQKAVELRHVTRRYGKKIALHDVSMAIPKGKAIGLLGENGAGKSTLLKLIAGIMKPTSGEIKVFDETPNWRIRERIAYLGDLSQWYKFQRIDEAIQYAANIFPHFQIEKAKEYLDFMKLDPQRKVEELSKGQTMRLQLILCLARQVDLFLLDEPLSGIDLISREKIIDLLIELLSEREVTLIISTHEIHEAEGLFEHVILLQNGKVVKEGDAEQLRVEVGSIQKVYREVFQ